MALEVLTLMILYGLGITQEILNGYLELLLRKQLQGKVKWSDMSIRLRKD